VSTLLIHAIRQAGGLLALSVGWLGKLRLFLVEESTMADPGRGGYLAKAIASRPKRHALIWALAIGATLAAFQAPARAASEVLGEPADMRLLVDNASTKEILHALSSSYGVTYTLPQDVGRTITGAYSGTLRQVLARVLDGTNYILKVSDSSVEVVVLGGSAPATIISAEKAIVSVSKNLVVPATLSSKGPPPLTSYLAGNGSGQTR